MIRFMVRDMLWLTVVLGLTVAYWLENRQRLQELSELKRLQVTIDEQETDFERTEHYLLDRDEQEGRVLLNEWAQQRVAKREAPALKAGPGDALVGEWEVLEMIDKGKVIDLKGKPELMKLKNGRIEFWNHEGERVTFQRCTVNAREIAINVTPPLPNDEVIWRLLYELKDCKLRIAYYEDFDKPRPSDFDALKDKQLVLCVLKKVR
jgi:hypothetical protein